MRNLGANFQIVCHCHGEWRNFRKNSPVMFLPRCLVVVVLCLAVACESPNEKISRIQGELLTALGERDFFEVKLNEQVLKLPLPPAPDLAAARSAKISEIKVETYALEHANLNGTEKQRFEQLSVQLDAILKRGNGAFFDPTKCVLPLESKDNPALTSPAFLKILLSKIPEYYAEVERCWQSPDPARARQAAAQSLLVLDWLEGLQEDATGARLAVKDFISLCHCAVLKD